MFFGTNKKLQDANVLIEKLQMANIELTDHNQKLNAKVHAQQEVISEYNKKFPFELGQVVYDIQLRSATGRFTKNKASREQSLINEVTVDKKNYFKLVDRYYAKDVFNTKEEAEKYMDTVCVD